MYRKYYSYNDMPKPVRETNRPPVHEEREVHKKEIAPTNPLGFLKNLESDDIILAVIAIMLIVNDCDDKLLLLAIAFVFITGFGEK